MITMREASTPKKYSQKYLRRLEIITLATLMRFWNRSTTPLCLLKHASREPLLSTSARGWLTTSHRLKSVLLIWSFLPSGWTPNTATKWLTGSNRSSSLAVLRRMKRPKTPSKTSTCLLPISYRPWLRQPIRYSTKRTEMLTWKRESRKLTLTFPLLFTCHSCLALLGTIVFSQSGLKKLVYSRLKKEHLCC